MNPGETIVIHAVENGWLVRSDYAPNDPFNMREFIVFNEMGYASGAGDECRECLLTFIARHFSKQSVPSKAQNSE